MIGGLLIFLRGLQFSKSIDKTRLRINLFLQVYLVLRRNVKKGEKMLPSLVGTVRLHFLQ